MHSIYLIISLFFKFTKTSKILKKSNKKTLELYLSKAIENQNYELASLLKHYIEFKKYEKTKIQSVTDER